MRRVPTGGGPGGWSPGHVSVKRIIDAIPDDGCLLVFNGYHATWRVKAADTGVLSCHVLDDKQYAKIRDMIICWKK